MPVNQNYTEIISRHPCFSKEAHFRYGRIHLPVAPACNIQCVYCDRKFDCPNESRPGVTSAVLTPEEALVRVQQAIFAEPQLRVVGIAGPGEPLHNKETFQTFALVRKQFPNISLCLSTNGLLLSEKLEELLQYGVQTVTVTVNTVRTETAEKVYKPMPQGISALLDAQKTGIQRASSAGIAIKVNTVLIPGINDGEIAEIAQAVSRWGAVLMNIVPLIPQANLSDYPKPSSDMLKERRQEAAGFLPQFTHCRQCRADACGIPGEE